jgi:hypothetical protein
MDIDPDIAAMHIQHTLSRLRSAEEQLHLRRIERAGALAKALMITGAVLFVAYPLAVDLLNAK